MMSKQRTGAPLSARNKGRYCILINLSTRAKQQEWQIMQLTHKAHKWQKECCLKKVGPTVWGREEWGEVGRGQKEGKPDPIWKQRCTGSVSADQQKHTNYRNKAVLLNQNKIAAPENCEKFTKQPYTDKEMLTSEIQGSPPPAPIQIVVEETHKFEMWRLAEKTICVCHTATHLEKVARREAKWQDGWIHGLY